MNVLVACEESQRVCMAFRDKGHNAFSCDIIDCSGGHPEWHIKQDVIPLLNGRCEFITVDGTKHKIESKWDLIIAHPPCTYLSNAGARWLYSGGELNQKRFVLGQKAKEFFMTLYNADCEKICIENPVPTKIYELPPYSQTIQPYEHGHPFTKKTCLWLKGLPMLQPSEIVEPIKGKTITLKSGKQRLNCWTMAIKWDKDRQKNRAKTFEGIAKAMAEQWG